MCEKGMRHVAHAQGVYLGRSECISMFVFIVYSYSVFHKRLS